MAAIPIDDPDDPRVAAYRDVKERDLVGRQGLFMAEGEVVLRAVLRSGRHGLDSVLLADKRVADLEPLLAQLGPQTPVYSAGQAVMDAVTGFHIHRGILAIGRRAPQPDPDVLLGGLGREAVALGLFGIANHDNMGGLFRNAAAFGVGAVILNATCCDPLYRKAIRTSVGAALTTPFAILDRDQDMVALFERHGFEALALSPAGAARLVDLEPSPRTAVLLGTEGPGLPDAVMARARTVSIPMAGAFDSLNVATTSGIVLHHLTFGPGAGAPQGPRFTAMTDAAPKFAHLRSRALVAVRGPDCRSFLQGLLTQNTETLADGEWRYGALLSPQGRLLYDMLLVGQAEAVLLDLPAAHRHDLVQRLSLYRLRAKVQVEAAEGGVCALWDADAAPPGWSADPRLPGLGWRAIGLAVPAAPGAAEVDEEAYDHHRLAHGVADTGRDALGQNTYPIEANLDLLHGIDFKKGCFVGQETTSRMKRRGQVRSRLLPVEIDGGPAPAPGTEVLAGELRAGEIVGGRDGRALALLRLDRIEGQALTADGRAVRAAAPDWLTDGIAPAQG